MASASVILKYFIAFFGIFLVVSTWVTMAEVVGGIPNPYFTAYMVHSFYSICYVLWIAWKVFPGGYRCNKAQDGKLSWKRAFIAGGVLNIVSFVGGLTWYLSLHSTSVAANTAIYMSLPAFIFVFSVPILRERVTLLKVLAVILQVSGVCVVAVSKDPCVRLSTNSSAANATSSLILRSGKESECHTLNTPLGYVFLIFSVITYALFEIIYKKCASFKDDPAAVPNSFRMIGLMGIHCLVYCWPIVLIVHFSGIQPFQWPTLLEFKYILMTATLDIVLNVSIVVVISLTSPLFAGVGQVLVLPVGVITDYIIHHYTLVWYGFIGVAAIFIGFVGFNVSHFWEKRREKTESVPLQSVNQPGEDESSGVGNVYSDEDTPLLKQRTRKTIGKQILLKYLI